MIGFSWVSHAEEGPMAAAAPGRQVRVAGPGPPWLVAHHSPTRVLTANWPGRLWRVEITHPASPTDMIARGGAPRPGAGYTRALGLRILDEMPLAPLFGSHGEAVLEIVRSAEALDAEQASRLAQALPEEAAAAYSRAWHRWIAATEPTLDAEGRDLSNTLNWYGSPINGGFQLISELVQRRANYLIGDAAFESDEAAGERWLIAPWSDARSALLYAAMADGAPDLVTSSERERLLNGYKQVFGA